MPRRALDHERLQVYQRSLAFITWAEPLLDRLPKSLSVRDQLDRAGTSIPLNIAEGNGKFTPADRCKFFDIARGSTLECAACLDVLVAKKRIALEQVMDGKQTLADIFSMRAVLAETFGRAMDRATATAKAPARANGRKGGRPKNVAAS